MKKDLLELISDKSFSGPKCIVLIPVWEAEKSDDIFEMENTDNYLLKANNFQIEKIRKQAVDIATSEKLFSYSPRILLSEKKIIADGNVLTELNLIPRDKISTEKEFNSLNNEEHVSGVGVSSSYDILYLDYGLLAYSYFRNFEVDIKNGEYDKYGMTPDTVNRTMKEIDIIKNDDKIIGEPDEHIINGIKKKIMYELVDDCNDYIWEIVEKNDGFFSFKEFNGYSEAELKGLNIKAKNSESKTQVFLFTNFESWLWFELLLLIESGVKRCKSCNSILPIYNGGKRYQGSTCPEAFNPKCFKQRSLKRKKKSLEKKE